LYFPFFYCNLIALIYSINMKKVIAFITLTLIFCSFADSKEPRHTVPISSDKAMAMFKSQCPSCAENGVFICGNDKINFGKTFEKNLFLGKPSRGYLLTAKLRVKDFISASRNTSDLSNLNEYLKNEFSRFVLVVVDSNYGRIEVLKPLQVDVTFPERLHSCLQDHNKPWGCCVASDCKKECCEKELGSAFVTVKWRDDITNDTLELNYFPNAGSTTLRRTDINSKKTIYFCNVIEVGTLIYSQ